MCAQREGNCALFMTKVEAGNQRNRQAGAQERVHRRPVVTRILIIGRAATNAENNRLQAL